MYGFYKEAINNNIAGNPFIFTLNEMIRFVRVNIAHLKENGVDFEAPFITNKHGHSLCVNDIIVMKGTR